MTTCPRSIDERTLVYFADNSKELLEAYVDSGEGIDRAGGFAIQVKNNFGVICPIADFYTCRSWAVFW